MYFQNNKIWLKPDKFAKFGNSLNQPPEVSLSLKKLKVTSILTLCDLLCDLLRDLQCVLHRLFLMIQLKL